MENRLPVPAVRKATEEIVSGLPDFWRPIRSSHVARASEEISWIHTPGGTVVDLGGGPGFHCSICVALGMRAISVDNFAVRQQGHRQDYFHQHDLVAQEIAARRGVEFIHTDLLTWEPPFTEGTIDVCMSLDVIEHMHCSPRDLYRKMVVCLKEGGLFLLGGPNAANLLKRLRVPLGKNIFASFEEWYSYRQFIGHVREPVVSDFHRIAADLGLERVEIAGRNWLGLSSGKRRWVAQLAAIADKPLRIVPSLCSDIYMLGRKPKRTEERTPR